eukprot:6492280-Amphidinium_carterae.5
MACTWGCAHAQAVRKKGLCFAVWYHILRRSLEKTSLKVTTWQTSLFWFLCLKQLELLDLLNSQAPKEKSFPRKAGCCGKAQKLEGGHDWLYLGPLAWAACCLPRSRQMAAFVEEIDAVVVNCELCGTSSAVGTLRI